MFPILTIVNLLSPHPEQSFLYCQWFKITKKSNNDIACPQVTRKFNEAKHQIIADKLYYMSQSYFFAPSKLLNFLKGNFNFFPLLGQSCFILYLFFCVGFCFLCVFFLPHHHCKSGLAGAKVHGVKNGPWTYSIL